MAGQYDIYEVDAALAGERESMGSKKKFWYRNPEDNKRWLFKYSRPVGGRSTGDDRPQHCGEHWAEKIAAEIARPLQLAHARVELARVPGESDWPGVIIEDFTQETGRGILIHGNELLIELDPNYPRSGTYHTSEHTLDNVLSTLSQEGITLPDEAICRPAIEHPCELFVGYLLLDALIGNTDRHHENWGILERGDRAELAPSYDHASSLGRELVDAERARRLNTTDPAYTVEAYAQRARSALYARSTDKKPVSPLEAFRLAAIRYEKAARFWQKRLDGLSEHALAEIVDRVPGEVMSEPAREFCACILRYNRDRILQMEID